MDQHASFFTLRLVRRLSRRVANYLLSAFRTRQIERDSDPVGRSAVETQMSERSDDLESLPPKMRELLSRSSTPILSSSCREPCEDLTETVVQCDRYTWSETELVQYYFANDAMSNEGGNSVEGESVVGESVVGPRGAK